MLYFVKEMRDFCRKYKPYEGLIETDVEKRKQFGAELKSKSPNVPNWRKRGVYPENDRVFPNQSFWHSVVNFCYLDPDNPREKFKIGEYSGAEAMCHCFVRKHGEDLITSDMILKIVESEAATAEFFRGDVPIPLIDERRENLIEAAWVVKGKWDGLPENIIFGSDSVDQIIETLLVNFPIAFGRDWVSSHHNALTFAKRANLWPLVYQGRALNSKELPKLADPENIGPVVDYQVPNALRYKGIHHYAPELAEKIDSRTPLKRQSREELAVRFATAETLLDLQEETGLTQVELDFPLWWEGRTAFKNGMNHMLVKTTDY